MKRKLIKLAMCAMAVLPMGVWADVVNNATATWLFDQYGKGVQLKKVDNATEVINMDGLYLAVGASDKTNSTLTSAMGRVTNSIKDGETDIFKSGYYTGVVFNRGRGAGFGSSADNASGGNRVSLRVTKPGKLYILCRNGGSGADVRVYKGTTQVASLSDKSNTGFQMITVETADETALYHITGRNAADKDGAGFSIYGVKYVVSSGAGQISKSVTIPDCGYVTFSGPHTYTIASHTDNGTTPTVYYASAENAGSITLSETTNNRIPACQGVIIKGAAGDVLTLKSVEEQTTVSNNLLVANLAAYALPVTTTINMGSDATYYNYIMVADGGSNAVFKHTSGSGDLSANKAFLRTTTNVTASARGLELNFGEGDVTGISEIEKLRNVGNEKFFDLQGRLVAQPTKGLYIVNGKKVIIK